MRSVILTQIKNFYRLLINNKLILLIFLTGAFLRFWGVDPGYHPYHSDEPMSYFNAIKMIVERKIDPSYYAYPSLIPIIHIIFYLFFFIPFTTAGLYRITTGIGVELVEVLYWGRYVTAILGSLSIILVYLLGKKYFGKVVGLISAFFLAVNYRHVLSSHLALFDVPNGFFLLLVLIASYWVLQRGKKIHYIVAGILAGLSMSVKFAPFGFIGVILAHIFGQQIPLRDVLKGKKFWLGLLVLSFTFLFTFLILNLPHFLNYSLAKQYLEYNNFQYRVGRFMFMPYPYGYFYNWGLGPVLSFLTIIGILWGLKIKFRETVILLVPMLLFILSLTFFSSGGLYVRNFVGIIPILVIFAAVGMHATYILFVKLANKKFALLSLFFLILVSSWPHLKNSWILDKNYQDEWSLSKVRQELIHNFSTKNIAGEHWILNQIFPKDFKIEKINFNVKSNFTLAELQEAGAEYVLLDSGFSERFFVWWMPLELSKGFLDVPKDLLYRTFPGSVFHELISRRSQEWAKPWQAPDINFWLVPIPKIPERFNGQLIFKEDFERSNNWKIKGSMGNQVENIGHTFGNKSCIGKGCALIGLTREGINAVKFRTFGTIQFSSAPISVEEKHSYQVKVKMKVDPKLPKEVRDGFFKVELFKDREDAEGDKPGDVVFVSARYPNDSNSWVEKEVFADIPKGFAYMTVSFQTYDNRGETFYFDDLVIEKSIKPLETKIERKPFPEELIFINSIL